MSSRQGFVIIKNYFTIIFIFRNNYTITTMTHMAVIRYAINSILLLVVLLSNYENVNSLHYNCKYEYIYVMQNP